VCLFRCNIFIGFRIIKEMPGLVGSGTLYINCLNEIKDKQMIIKLSAELSHNECDTMHC